MPVDSEKFDTETSNGTNHQRDPPVSAGEHDPPNHHPAPESPATCSAPTTPSKSGSSLGPSENQPPSASSASPGDYHHLGLASPPHHGATNSPSVNAPPSQLGSPPHMHYPPPPHPHAYYAYGVMAYHPMAPPTQPHLPPPPAGAGPAPPNNSSNSANPQHGQQQQLTSPPRNAAPYPPPPPHGYYPIHYAPQAPHMHMAPQPYHPYAAQDWSKGRSNGVSIGEQQQQLPPPPPPPHPMPMHPPHMYGWAPVPVAHPMPPGQYVPVPPPGARYPGWGPPPPQPQRAFNHNRKSAGHPGISTGSSGRKKVLGKSTSGNKARKLIEARETASSPSQLASSIRDEIENTGCTCKKTRCLKLYCQCFGVKIYCGHNCRCYDCANTKEQEKQRQDAMRNILSRNPLAFDTKFTDPRASINNASDVISAEGVRLLAHKLGCKCRKSACMKKVCFLFFRI